MDHIIDARLVSFIDLGDRILKAYRMECANLEAPTLARVGEGLAPHGLGIVFRSVVPGTGPQGRQLGRDLIKQKNIQVQSEIDGRYDQQYRNWLRDVEVFLGEISILRRHIVAPGNSQQLVESVHQAETKVRTETKIRYILRQLQNLRGKNLIWNQSLAPSMPKVEREKNPLQTLRSFENLLRNCIESTLGRGSKTWWDDLIPKDIRVQAEKRKSQRENLWALSIPTSDSLIDYLDFKDYRKIIFANWPHFSVMFGNPNIIDTKLMELEPIRIDIAHSRRIDATARAKLDLYYTELKAHIDSAG